MGAYVSALVAQLLAPPPTKAITSSLTTHDAIHDAKLGVTDVDIDAFTKDASKMEHVHEANSEEESIRSSNLNYTSPSPSDIDSSVFLLSKHVETEEDTNSNEALMASLSSNSSPHDTLMSDLTVSKHVQHKEEKPAFVNQGRLNYQRIRNQWLHEYEHDEDGENDGESNEDCATNKEIWERIVINEEEEGQLIGCIAEEKPFAYSVPLDTLTEIMNKLWKQEEIMGYEITSKHHASSALALEQL